MAQMSALRRRMIDDMTVRNLSPATHIRHYGYLANGHRAAKLAVRFMSCSRAIRAF